MRGFRRRTARHMLVLGAMVGVACAEGSAVNDPGFHAVDGAGGYGGGDTTTTDDTTSATTTGATTGTTTTETGAGGTGTGGAGAGGGQGGQGGGVAPCDFAPANTCATSEEIPGIDGDQNSDTRLEHGIGSKWYRVLVKEAVSSVISFPALSFTATLTSPPGMKYDLYVYPGDGSGINCGAAAVHASGVPEAFSKTWKDSMGSEDSTWFVFEIRYVSGPDCDAGSTWELKVQGHTSP